MKIAHIESSMDWGGQELRIVEQTEWLNRNGHPCLLIARPGSAIAKNAVQRGLPLQELEIRGSAHPGTLYRLIRTLRRFGAEVLDCHGNRDSTYGAYVHWLTGLPVVRSRHVTDPIRIDGWRRRVWRSGNSGVIVTAQRIKDMLSEASLVEPSRVSVAVAGVDEQRFNPGIDGVTLRRKLGIADGDLVVANVGMIRPDKGQLQFVQAARQLLIENQSISFIQLGESTGQTESYKQAVLAAAGEDLASGKIRFLGYQPDIENWLAMADIVVIASVATEAQTRLVSQAFLMKKNVVATTVGGLPEMISDGRTGLLCRPDDPAAIAAAVRRLIADPALAERLRESAYDHAQRFMSFNYMMDGMLGAYREAALRAGRG